MNGIHSAYRWRNHLIKPSTQRFASELERNQKLSSDELEHLSWEKIKKTVEEAFIHVPFYRRFYSSYGYENGDLKTADDLSSLPVLEKQHIIEFKSDLFRRGFNEQNTSVSTTGGTTGKPLAVYHDRNIPLEVMSWRWLARWGLSPANNSGYLYRAIPSASGAFIRNTVFWPTNRQYISAKDMTLKNMASFASAILRKKPKYLVGYVGALDVFAEYLRDLDVQIPGLQAIWTTAAPLPDTTREFLSSIFSAPAFSQYGSCEFYGVACECPSHSGMHIDTDVRHVEVVDHQNQVVAKGEFGDLLITDLIGRVFPLIRYRIGDRGRLLRETCPCGDPFPLMDFVRGRVSDFICLPSGRRIPGEYWTTLFDDFPDAVSAFWVEQTDDYSISIHYFPASNDVNHVIEIVSSRAIEMTNGEVLVKMENSKSAVPVTEGKPKFVVSALSELKRSEK